MFHFERSCISLTTMTNGTAVPGTTSLASEGGQLKRAEASWFYRDCSMIGDVTPSYMRLGAVLRVNMRSEHRWREVHAGCNLAIARVLATGRSGLKRCCGRNAMSCRVVACHLMSHRVMSCHVRATFFQHAQASLHSAAAGKAGDSAAKSHCPCSVPSQSRHQQVTLELVTSCHFLHQRYREVGTLEERFHDEQRSWSADRADAFGRGDSAILIIGDTVK